MGIIGSGRDCGLLLRIARGSMLAIATLLAASGVQAQSWPTKSAVIIVPAAPGGGPDLLARTLAERLSARTGKAFVVENRPSANSIVGIQTTANAAPDGHTLLMLDRSVLAVNPLLHARLPYDAKALASITEIARVNLLWVVREDAPYRTWNELVTRLRETNQALAVGTSALGTTPHLSLELIKAQLGTGSLTAVPYRGVSQAVVGLLAGDVQAMITGPVPVLGHMRAGKLRALAVGAERRMSLLPEVPTLAEAGMPSDLLIPTHFTLHAPAATLKATIETIGSTVRTVLNEAGFASRFDERGLLVVGSTAEEVDRGIAADGVMFAKALREAGMKAE